MPIRVTNQYQNQVFIDTMFQQQKALSDTRQKIASGFDVSAAGDDPANASTIAQYQNLVNRIDSQTDRMGLAENMLSQQEGVISNAQNLMIRAKEIANHVSQRQQLATEVWGLRNAMVSAANTKVLGKYIYGGTADTVPPVTLSATPYTFPTITPPAVAVEANNRYVFTTAQGVNNSRTINMTDDEVLKVTTGVPAGGTSFFADSINALERLGRTLEGYRTTPEVSNAAPNLGGAAFVFPADFHGQTSALQNAMTQIDTAKDRFTIELSDIGGRTNRLNQARTFLASVR
jgi:flagellin-like hook-associated protein FlgL